MSRGLRPEGSAGRGRGRAGGAGRGGGSAPQGRPAGTPSSIAEAIRNQRPVTDGDEEPLGRAGDFDPAGGPGDDELPDYGDLAPHADDDGEGAWLDAAADEELGGSARLRERPEIVIELVGGSLRARVDERVATVRADSAGNLDRARRLQLLGGLLVEDQGAALRAPSLREAYLNLRPRMQRDLATLVTDRANEDVGAPGARLARDTAVLINAPFGVVHLGFFRWRSYPEQERRLLEVARALANCDGNVRGLAGRLARESAFAEKTLRQDIAEIRALAEHPMQVQIARRLFPRQSREVVRSRVGRSERMEMAINLAIVGVLDFPLDNTPKRWTVIVRDEHS